MNEKAKIKKIKEILDNAKVLTEFYRQKIMETYQQEIEKSEEHELENIRKKLKS